MWDFIVNIWRGIGEAMWLNPRVFETVQTYPSSSWIILAIALIGGASLLLGQSVILFVNQVRPGRFVLSLLVNGIVLTISFLIWALTIWFVGRALFDQQVRLADVLRMVALGAAPYAFGFLVLAPYAGTFIGNALGVWSLVVVLRGIMFLYSVPFWPALVAVGGGWLLLMLMQFTVGRPLVWLRDRISYLAAGTKLDARVADILLAYAAEEPEAPSSVNAR